MFLQGAGEKALLVRAVVRAHWRLGLEHPGSSMQTSKWLSGKGLEDGKSVDLGREFGMMEFVE